MAPRKSAKNKLTEEEIKERRYKRYDLRSDKNGYLTEGLGMERKLSVVQIIVRGIKKIFNWGKPDEPRRYRKRESQTPDKNATPDNNMSNEGGNIREADVDDHANNNNATQRNPNEARRVLRKRAAPDGENPKNPRGQKRRRLNNE